MGIVRSTKKKAAECGRLLDFGAGSDYAAATTAVAPSKAIWCRTGALPPAFIVPMLGYVGLTVFAIAAARTKVRDADVVAAPSPH